MTMRMIVCGAAVLGCVAVTTELHAQEAADLVRQAIEEAMDGECSDVLSQVVKFACEEQMPGLGKKLANMGDLKEVTYRGKEQTPNGPADVYVATHANGKMLWLAIKASDGKLSAFWSPS